jgi:predicted dinucleotide-binding enzyme
MATTTAIIGVGNIGSAVATHLVNGGERVILASGSDTDAKRLADKLGELANAAPVDDAIDAANAVLFAVWFDITKELVAQHGPALPGKVVIDPSNPISIDEHGNIKRTLPDGVSAGSVIAGLVPPRAHFVKAFGTLAAASLAAGANRSPRRAVLFYATDDPDASSVAERLISAAGFDPVKAGGVDASLRIEALGDLHDMGGLEGRLVDSDEATSLVGAAVR